MLAKAVSKACRYRMASALRAAAVANAEMPAAKASRGYAVRCAGSRHKNARSRICVAARSLVASHRLLSPVHQTGDAAASRAFSAAYLQQCRRQRAVRFVTLIAALARYASVAVRHLRWLRAAASATPYAPFDAAAFIDRH